MQLKLTTQMVLTGLVCSRRLDILAEFFAETKVHSPTGFTIVFSVLIIFLDYLSFSVY